MNKKDQLEATLRGYLLGHLDESDERGFEEGLMDNDQLFEEVGSLVDLVEDDLVEDFLRDALSDSEKRSFELRFLGSPRTQEKLILGRALLRRAGVPKPEATTVRPRTPKASWLRSWLDVIVQPVPALAAVMFILLIGGGVWSEMRVDRLRNEVDQMSSQQARQVEIQQSLENQLASERQRAAGLADELESAQATSASLRRSLEAPKGNVAPVVASMVLRPGLYRSSGEVGTLRLARQHRLVELRLDLGLDEFPVYRAALCNAAGDELMVENGLNAHHEEGTVLVIAQFPASLLQKGQYHIRLSGVSRTGEVEPLDLYYFRVRTE